VIRTYQPLVSYSQFPKNYKIRIGQDTNTHQIISFANLSINGVPRSGKRHKLKNKFAEYDK